MRELILSSGVNYFVKPTHVEVEGFTKSLGIEIPQSLLKFLTTQNPFLTLHRFIFLDGNNSDEFDYEISWAQFSCPVGSSFQALNEVLYEEGNPGLVVFGYDGAGNFFVVSVRDMDFGVVYYYNWSYDLEEDVDKVLILLADDFESFLIALK